MSTTDNPFVWLDIGTAPRDRDILLFVPFRFRFKRQQIFIGRWVNPNSKSKNSSYYKYSNAYAHGPAFQRGNPPTHWMELPPQPHEV
jgi:hypothetical protein